MGNIVHMQDFQHGYSNLYRRACRGNSSTAWREAAVTALWLIAYCIMCIDLWLYGLGV